MDNILLEKMPESETVLSAHYTLDHILLTGHATDDWGAPPTGLQLNLEPVGRPGEVSDTFDRTLMMVLMVLHAGEGGAAAKGEE